MIYNCLRSVINDNHAPVVTLIQRALRTEWHGYKW